MTWPQRKVAPSARFASRLAAVEQVLRAKRLAIVRFQSGLLDLIEFSLAIDIADGGIDADTAERTYVAKCEAAVHRCGLVLPDPSMPYRIERIRNSAASHYSP